MKHKPVYLPYDFACAFVQANHIRNRYHYEKWWEETRPPLPKVPDRVYKEWQGWNHYLRNNEEVKSFEKTRMNKQTPPRPLWEAIRWAHQIAKEHNITSERLWHEWHKAHPDLLPPDIPKGPDQVYDDWCGWPTFLGKTIQSKITTETKMVAVFAVHTIVGQPPNVVRPHVHKNGYVAMVDLVQSEDGSLGKPYQVFEWEPELKPKVDEILHRFGQPQQDGTFIVPNVPQLMWELSSILLIHKRSS